MIRLLAFLLGLSLVILTFSNNAYAVFPSVKKSIDNQQLDRQKSKSEMSIEELLGPKDNFPFLPDNHRDSGTGKFARFD